MVVVQANVKQGTSSPIFLILPLKPQGLLVLLCRATSTYVGALKLPLTCLTSGRRLVCGFGNVDVVVESGSISKLLAEPRSPACDQPRFPSLSSVTPTLVLTLQCSLFAFQSPLFQICLRWLKLEFPKCFHNRFMRKWGRIWHPDMRVHDCLTLTSL